MSSQHLNQTKPFCSPQDQIQWGILFLSRHLSKLSPWEREHCLQNVWEWARQCGDLLYLQMIRDYRDCCKESGPTYRRHRDWFLNNWNNPEFWAEWEKRFPRLVTLPQISDTEERGEPLGQIAAEITRRSVQKMTANRRGPSSAGDAISAINAGRLEAD